MIRMMSLVTLPAIGNAPVGSYSVYEEELKGNQKKLDVDGDGKIEGEDFAKLRAKKNEDVLDEEEYDSAKDSRAASHGTRRSSSGFAYTPIKQRRGEDRMAAVKRAHAEDERRKEAIRRITQQQAAARSAASGDKNSVRVKNPETGQEILATSAYAAGPQHPAYAAAKSALKIEIVKRMKESNGRIRENLSEDNPTPSNDHEVSMANNALETIIQHANTLKEKLGQEEKDIPAWIQDHISNAANFIQQAANNYHEYNTPDKPMEEGEHLKPSEDHKNPHKDPHMVHEDMCEGDGCDEMDEVAPDGWEGTVKAMKKYKKIDNPWALAYYMKSKGYSSHKNVKEETGLKVKNPETGKEINATSALSPDHPAYAAAKRLLQGKKMSAGQRRGLKKLAKTMIAKNAASEKKE